MRLSKGVRIDPGLFTNLTPSNVKKLLLGNADSHLAQFIDVYNQQRPNYDQIYRATKKAVYIRERRQS